MGFTEVVIESIHFHIEEGSGKLLRAYIWTDALEEFQNWYADFVIDEKRRKKKSVFQISQNPLFTYIVDQPFCRHLFKHYKDMIAEQLEEYKKEEA